MASIAAPPTGPTPTGVSGASQRPGTGGREVGGGDGGDVEARRAVARIASVVRSVWDAVRVEQHMSGLHVLVQPVPAGSAEGARESAQMLAAVQEVLRSVCHAEVPEEGDRTD
jgi:hypothetical protein